QQADDEESQARQHVFHVVPAAVLLILILLRRDGGLYGLRVEGPRAEAATLGVARDVFLTAGALEDLNVGHGRCSLFDEARSYRLIRDERAVCVGPPVAEELPCVSDLADFIKVEVGNDQVVFVARGLCDYLSARVAEIALAVELADVPG